MQNCPVCEKSLEEPLPPFCDQCGWDLKNDLTLAVFIGDIPESVIEEYRGRLAAARRNWTEKAGMAQKLRDFEKRLGELEKQKEGREVDRKKWARLEAVEEKLRDLEQRLDESEKRRKEEKAEAGKHVKNAPTKEHRHEEAGANWIEPVTSMEFVFVPGGTFMMGDVFGDGCDDEKPVHEVTLDDFYIGKFPVTQGQWKKVMGDNPSKFQNGDDYPVETVSWDDAMTFIEKLQEMNGNEFGFNLPTEAQWEYAGRSGGKKERYAGGEDIDALAWYDGNSGGTTHPVGRKRPNGLGLRDMSGNVWEWCRDWYGAYSSGAVNNPVGPADGAYRVLRGGAWNDPAVNCRAAYRSGGVPGSRYAYLGFRLALRPGQR